MVVLASWVCDLADSGGASLMGLCVTYLTVVVIASWVCDLPDSGGGSLWVCA